MGEPDNIPPWTNSQADFLATKGRGRKRQAMHAWADGKKGLDDIFPKSPVSLPAPPPTWWWRKSGEKNRPIGGVFSRVLPGTGLRWLKKYIYILRRSDEKQPYGD